MQSESVSGWVAAVAAVGMLVVSLLQVEPLAAGVVGGVAIGAAGAALVMQQTRRS